MKDTWLYRRGDIYLANLGTHYGSEQGGYRPVLLIQNNLGNYYGPTLIVAPITSRHLKKAKQPTHFALVDVDNYRTSFKTKTTAEWSAVAILRILKNPVYRAGSRNK